jgi:hypothetical protein
MERDQGGSKWWEDRDCDREPHASTGVVTRLSHAALFSAAGVAAAVGSGCVPLGAPAIPLFGAYFPGWLLCAFCGVIGAVVVRLGFIRIGLDDILPVRLPVYVAVATIIGLLVSWLGFGR